MPDSTGFDHLTDWGRVHHRCIDCGWPPEDRFVGDHEREVHHARHERERQKDIERRRRENLAKARALQKLAARENGKIEERVR